MSKLATLFALFWVVILAVSCGDRNVDLEKNKTSNVISEDAKNESKSLNKVEPNLNSNFNNEEKKEVPADSNNMNINISDIAKTFKQLQKMNEKPIYIDPKFDSLCGTITSENAASFVENGPHSSSAINIYMNSLAAEAFKSKTFPYPIGSIVIKDKNAVSTRVLNDKGVGGMVKREKGYDPENGDWEYFYFTDIKEIEQGKIDSCIQCHSRASKKDFIFAKWNIKK